LHKIKYERVAVPFQIDPVAVPMQLIDINGDESAYAVAVAETGSGGGGGGGSSAPPLGTTHTTGFSVTSSGVTIAAQNLTRRSLLVVNNDDTNPVYLKAGGAAATADNGSIKLAPGKSYTTDATGDTYKAITTAGQTVSITVEEIAVTWP
jgi:hypothetical protein